MNLHTALIVSVTLHLIHINATSASQQASAHNGVLSKQDVEEKIDSFVEHVMACVDIPGLVLSVVRDGQPFIAKGYGVKDLDSLDPVTNRTLFLIASNTKAFAATVTGMVLEEHDGYDWHTPVKDILGEYFYLSDPIRTESVNFRDMLGHRTGLARNEPMRAYGYDPEEFFRRLQYLPFAVPYRDEYLYNNIMYGLTTHAIEVLEEGTRWEDLVTSKIYDPLRMDDSTFLHLAEDRWEEFAKGHYEDDNDDNKQVSLEVAQVFYVSMSSSGSIASTAIDITKWILMQLNDGQSEDGTQVVSEDIIRAVRTPVNIDRGTERYRSPNFPVAWNLQKYGLGMLGGLYRSYDMFGHTGSQSGSLSMLTFLPDADHGVFVGVNKSPDYYSRDYITMYIYDLLLGIEPWLTEDDVCELIKRELKPSHDNKPRFETNPPPMNRDLSKFEGQYGNYAYGNLTVYVNTTDDLLYLSYGPRLVFRLQEEGGDNFLGTGMDIFWYWSLEVVFKKDGDDVVEVEVDFDELTPPTFVKDLDWNAAPAPPERCP